MHLSTYLFRKHFSVCAVMFLFASPSSAQLQWSVTPANVIGTRASVQVSVSGLQGATGFVTLRYISADDSLLMDSSFSELDLQPVDSDGQTFYFTLDQLQSYLTYAFKPVLITNDSIVASDMAYSFHTGDLNMTRVNYTITESTQPKEMFIVSITLFSDRWPLLVNVNYGPTNASWYTNVGKAFQISGPNTTFIDTISNGIAEEAGISYQFGLTIYGTPLYIELMTLASNVVTTGSFMTVIKEGTATVDFAVYPNPVLDHFTIQTKTTGEVVLSDVSGREVMRTNVPAGNTTLSRNNNLAHGIYFLRLTPLHGKSRPAQTIVLK